MYLSSYSGVCSVELQLCLWGPTLEILKPGQPWRKPASVKPACQPAHIVLSSGKVGSAGLLESVHTVLTQPGTLVSF